MNGNTRKRIYVDQDDVLADYKKRFVFRLQLNPKNLYPQMEYGFFTSLEEIPGAIDGINLLSKHFDTWILTRPSMQNPLCYTEKRVWVEQHLGMEWVKRLIITPDKSLYMGDYLIDDTPWPGFQGEQLLFGSVDYPNWDSVLVKLQVK